MRMDDFFVVWMSMRSLSDAWIFSLEIVRVLTLHVNFIRTQKTLEQDYELFGAVLVLDCFFNT